MPRANANPFAFDLPDPDAPGLFDGEAAAAPAWTSLSPAIKRPPVPQTIDTIRAAIAETLAYLATCETNPYLAMGEDQPEDGIYYTQYHRVIFRLQSEWLRGAERVDAVAAYNAQAVRLGILPI